MVELKAVGLQYAYAHSETDVFSNLDFAASSGEIVWIEGRNGVGKTTLLEVLAGLRSAHVGSVTLGEEAASGANVSFLPSVPPVYAEVAGDEHISLVQMLWDYSSREADDYAERVRNVAHELHVPMEDGVFSLSSGMKEKLAFALMFARSTRALLLDEPFAALDSSSVLKCQALLARRAEDDVVVLSSHAPHLVSPLNPRRFSL